MSSIRWEAEFVLQIQEGMAGEYEVIFYVFDQEGGMDTGAMSIEIFADAPVAEFGGSPTQGCAPLRVDFVDQSTGDPAAWSWHFGDGGSSEEQNPSHTYDSLGTYTVTLIAHNVCGSDEELKSAYVTVSPCVTRGDVNLDEDVDLLDILTTANHILDITTLEGEALWAADCNSDGDIDLLDLLGIANVILGLGECVPGG